MTLNKLINKINIISPIIFQAPWVGAIGNMSEQIYMGLLKARRNNKKIIFLYPYDLFWKFKFSKFGKGINRELCHLESPLIFKLPNIILIFLNSLLTFVYCIKILIRLILKLIFRNDFNIKIIPDFGIEDLWGEIKNNRFNIDDVYNLKWEEQFNSKIKVSINKKKLNDGKKILNQMGIKDEDWFVCLFVRDSNYYGINEGYVKQIRNSNIEDYLDSIKYIINNGGWVIRMGDKGMRKLPKQTKLIDYANSIYKSDLMDIYLIQKCKFFFGGSSGIWDVANLFQKKQLLVNIIPFTQTPAPKKSDIKIDKHIMLKSTNNIIPIVDLLDVRLNNNDYKFVDNSPQEILQSLINFLKEDEIIITNLQKEWLKKIRSSTPKILKNIKDSKFFEFKNESDKLIELYKTASYLIGRSGYIDSSFLLKNYKKN